MRIEFSWGTGIALVYTAFALATSGFVAFAIARPVHLVSDDYYQQALHQDGQRAAEENALALTPLASVTQPDGRSAQVALGASQAGATGTVRLYRASDAAADRTVPLAVDGTGRQTFDLGGLRTGHWVVQLRWTSQGRDYYMQRQVVVR